jgi:hypothetical protein
MQILPISSVEKHTVGDGRPGEMTKKLHKSFIDLIKSSCCVARKQKEK